MDRREALSFGTTAALCLCVPGLGLASIPSGRRILQRARRRLRRIGPLQLTLVGQHFGTGSRVSIGERWIFDTDTKAVRVDTNGPNAKVASWSSSGSLTGDPSIAPTPAERLILRRLFADVDPVALARDLGVDTRSSRLALAPQNRVALVVGRSGKSDPQLWFDQEGLEPLRVVFPGTEGQVDVQLLQWGPPPGSGLFPNQIQVRIGRRLRRALDTQQARSTRPKPASR